ncbi:MAG: hypothetical protein OJF62_001758 [Pseudolabrys sp.]|jgi:hypothetical protein|nr:hypothetical protein [Pseudolabrys sp.]
MKFHSLACLIMIGVATLLPAHRAAAGEPRAVVELFTSQGCSSCPKADRLLGELSRDPSLVTLSLPVDYWDYLGWKDTLALHGHTARERAYAAVRGDRAVYTPQAVIDGKVAVVGNDRQAIEDAIAKSPQTTLHVPVSLRVEDGKIVASLDASGDASTAEVWLCPTIARAVVKVMRGENSGHELTYTNVVRRWVKLGDYTGKAQTFTASLDDVSGDGADGFTVLVQRGAASKPGPVIGAAQTAAR